MLPAGPTITLTDPDARSALLDSYRLDEPTWLRLTLVSTLDGRAAGGDGTSESLTSRVDRTVLGVVRELSDAVLVGAESLRREPGLVPRARPLVVLSASGHLG
ncbi:MAG: dihydrofolate reductase family protein, partial [Yonghaparkia sp.]|nr:dihydrofolate reductase family protein [Microcella sp.]